MHLRVLGFLSRFGNACAFHNPIVLKRDYRSYNELIMKQRLVMMFDYYSTVYSYNETAYRCDESVATHRDSDYDAVGHTHAQTRRRYSDYVLA